MAGWCRDLADLLVLQAFGAQDKFQGQAPLYSASVRPKSMQPFFCACWKKYASSLMSFVSGGRRKDVATVPQKLNLMLHAQASGRTPRTRESPI